MHGMQKQAEVTVVLRKITINVETQGFAADVPYIVDKGTFLVMVYMMLQILPTKKNSNIVLYL